FSFCVALFEAVYGWRPLPGVSLDSLAAASATGGLKTTITGKQLPRRARRALLQGLSARPEDRHPSTPALLRMLNPKPPTRALGLGAAAAIAAMGAIGSQQLRGTERSPCKGADRKLASIWDDARWRSVQQAFAATQLPRANEIFASVSRTIDAYARDWAAV